MPKRKTYWSVMLFDRGSSAVTIKSWRKETGSYDDIMLIGCNLIKGIYRATWIDCLGYQDSKICAKWLETLCVKARGLLEGSDLHQEFLLYKNFGDVSDFIENYGELRIWSRTKYTVFNGTKWVRIRGVKMPPTDRELEYRWMSRQLWN